ncbi:hypothetical protein GCM10009602_03160 [Nocardiopsis tropica]
MLSGVDDRLVGSAPAKGGDDGRGLDEVGARADDVHDPGVLAPKGGARCHDSHVSFCWGVLIVAEGRGAPGRAVFLARAVPSVSPWCHHVVTSAWLCD